MLSARHWTAEIIAVNTTINRWINHSFSGAATVMWSTRHTGVEDTIQTSHWRCTALALLIQPHHLNWSRIQPQSLLLLLTDVRPFSHPFPPNASWKFPQNTEFLTRFVDATDIQALPFARQPFRTNRWFGTSRFELSWWDLPTHSRFATRKPNNFWWPSTAEICQFLNWLVCFALLRFAFRIRFVVWPNRTRQLTRRSFAMCRVFGYFHFSFWFRISLGPSAASLSTSSLPSLRSLSKPHFNDLW